MCYNGITKQWKELKLMQEDYKKKYEDLANELRWFEHYHKMMMNHFAKHYDETLAKHHEDSWAEIYLIMQQFGIMTYEDEKALQNK